MKFQNIYYQVKDVVGKDEYLLFCRTYEYLRDLLTETIAVNILSTDVTWKVFKQYLSRSLKVLTQALATFYNKKPYLIIDEYDPPIIHAYTNKFKKDLGDFFAVFYGTVLKDNA
jgi:hypothetical protein